MRLITNLEHVILRHETESRMCRLEIVDRLTHISFGRKDECPQTVIVVLDLMISTNENPRHTSSAAQISFRRFMTSASLSFEYLRIAHRDWIGSMILLDMLQARAKRVVLL
jgi:hypothetical protein